MSQLPITVVVPIKNEALNLPTCLATLKSFEHVIVVDSSSSDESAHIARDWGAEVVDFQWNGQFPKKRNWILRHHPISTPWVLFLDADEKVTPDFVAELEQLLPTTSCNGFWVPFDNYFMGRLLRHGDKFRKLPLLRVGYGEFERIDEQAWSQLDMEVHEHLIVEGEVGEMKSPLVHNDFKNLEAYYARHNQYSTWEANRFLSLGDGESQRFTQRQKIKYRLLTSPLFPLLYFCGSYIGKRGFLDGIAGFRFAVSKMF
ncbi:MAG TPA: glycosyltransferase family 2 protein, partial [Abditibacterium sp.]